MNEKHTYAPAFIGFIQPATCNKIYLETHTLRMSNTAKTQKVEYIHV